jgi:hypothetical protein
VDSNGSTCFTNHPTLIVTLSYGELLNHWSNVGDTGYYGNSKGFCGRGVSAVIGSDVDVHIANSVNNGIGF